MKIKTEDQKTEIPITQKDIKNWITPKERQETSNQQLNAQKALDKFVDTVRKADEVLDGVMIHHGEKNCKLYVKDSKTSDGKQEKSVVITDKNTGRAVLGSTLTEQEYSNLKQTGNIELSALRRDPQTLGMNQKSIDEAEARTRANDEGCLTGLTEVRRFNNLGESGADFVAKDSVGSTKLILRRLMEVVEDLFINKL